MARNKFPGTCNDCGKHVAAGAGHFQRVPGRGWIVRHVECVATARAENAKRADISTEGLTDGIDLTAFAIGAVMVPASLGVIPFVLWLARLNGFV